MLFYETIVRVLSFVSLFNYNQNVNTVFNKAYTYLQNTK